MYVVLKLIETLNNYLGSKGKKYKSHYHTILVWENKNKPADKPKSESEKSIENMRRIGLIS